MGIKELKKQHTPKMYERSHWNNDKRLCSKEEQAEQTAIFLEKNWGTTYHLHEGDEFHLSYLLEKEGERYYIHNLNIEEQFNLGKITVEEIKAAIKSIANNKSGGIDTCTAEILKCLDEGSLGEIAYILTEYWRQESVPDDMTRARVVSLSKKRNPRMQANYRPISLLNAVYKLYAKIIKADYKMS